MAGVDKTVPSMSGGKRFGLCSHDDFAGTTDNDGKQNLVAFGEGEARLSLIRQLPGKRTTLWTVRLSNTETFALIGRLNSNYE
jgi:hypothetical protein